MQRIQDLATRRHIIWTLEQLIETRRLWLSLALVARFTPRISRVLATSTNLDTFLAGHSRERNNRERSGEIGQALSTRPCFSIRSLAVSRRQSSRRVQSTWAAGFHARVESRRRGNGGKDGMEGKGNRVKLHYTPSALPFFPSFLRRADPIAAANVIVNCGMEKNCARSARDDPRKKKKGNDESYLSRPSSGIYIYVYIYVIPSTWKYFQPHSICLDSNYQIFSFADLSLFLLLFFPYF